MTTNSLADFVADRDTGKDRWSLAAAAAVLTVICVGLIIWGGLAGLVAGILGTVFFGNQVVGIARRDGHRPPGISLGHAARLLRLARAPGAGAENPRAQDRRHWWPASSLRRLADGPVRQGRWPMAPAVVPGMDWP